MERKRVLCDKDFTRVVVTPNRRAVQMTYRVKPDALYVTVPVGTLDRAILEGIDALRARLLANQKRVARRLIDFDFKIDSPCFKLTVLRGSSVGFQLRIEADRASILAPAGIDFRQESIQQMLHGAIERAMKRRASVVLPPLLHSLAVKHALPFKQVKIGASKGRWGSCSGEKVINLSCYLLLLPTHLIEYVLLHELAHTKEMNHSERFWSELNRLTNGQAAVWREEMKQYETKF